jgi:putative holliday junction resolvase
MSRIMSIDYGDVRIGIALTDPMKIISSGFKTLPNDNQVFKEIGEICITKDVEAIVFGIPFDESSKIGFAAKKVIEFAEVLIEFLYKKAICPVMYEQDEGYTTSEALDIMKEMKIKKRRKKKIVDQIAAAKILSEFLAKPKKKIFDINKYSEEIRKNEQK